MTPTPDRVRKIIETHLGVVISADTVHIVDELGADSLDTIELLMAIEAEFEIEIPEEDAVNLGTVGDVIALVERLVQG